MLHSGGVLTQRSLPPSLLELINNLCKFSQSSSFPTSSTPLTKIMKLATICVNRLGQYELQSFALVLTGASHKALCVPSYVAECGGSGGEDGKAEEHEDEVTLLCPCWSSAMELSQINPGIKPLRLASFVETSAQSRLGSHHVRGGPHQRMIHFLGL